MKIEIEISDSAFEILSVVSETEKRTPAWLIQQLVEADSVRRINESKVIIEYVANEASRPREKAKRKSLRSVRGRVFEKSNGKCAYCDSQLIESGNWHVDHVVPISRGGADEIENMVAACHRCNTKKSDKPASEFRSQQSNGK